MLPSPAELWINWLITSNSVNRCIKLNSARLLVSSYLAFQWIELTENEMRRIAS
jgi:diketogulonate reductase-like aldo/keto reductase